MARKLKSDKLLFTATLLLVCTSVVMVYSASAVDRDGELPRCPICILVKQVAWALIGLVLVPLVMRDRLPHLSAAGGDLDRARRRRRGAASRCCSGRAGQRRDPLARLRRARRAAVGAREDRRDHLHRGAARAADGSHRRGRRTRCCRSASSLGVMVGLILAEPDLGTAVMHRDDRGGDGLLPPASATATCSGCCWRDAAGALPAGDDVGVPVPARHWRSSIPGPIRSATATR